jgi:cell wall-associated NlpC family hydrolase
MKARQHDAGLGAPPLHEVFIPGLYRPHRWRPVIRSGPRAALGVVALLVMIGLLTSTVASGIPEQIQSKQADAERVLAEMEQLDLELGEAIEAWNGANVRLDELGQEIDRYRRNLGIARASFDVAQRRLSERLIALYTNREPSTFEIVLGASSLDDLLDRLDTAERVSELDVRVLEQVGEARSGLVARKKELERARADQRRVLDARAARREYIEQRLAERQQLYDSIREQIATLEAEERERQQRLAEEARRRQAERQRIAAAANVEIPPAVAATQGIGTAPGSALGEAVVSIALRYLGVPYVWGGASPDVGFDCSGLVVYAFAQAGRPGLPHYTGSLWTMGVPVSYSQLRPGDLVWFYNGGHMGIYMGGGQMVHSPRTGDVVKISDVSPGSAYYPNFLGARRIT